MRVLVVDDDQPSLRAFARRLRRRRLAVSTAASAAEAMAIASRVPPDLALVDYMLGAHPALPLIRWLRATVPDCRIVAVSGHDAPEVVVDAMHAGADGFARKPFDPERVLAVVRRAPTPSEEAPARLLSRDEAERRMVEEALACTGGNISAAARLLKMQRRQLQRLMDRFDIVASSFMGRR